jgi:tetratricopeptide (TPR) repeat protein
MKKALIIALTLVLAAGVLAAQDFRGKGRVAGIVLDEGGKPIEGARVKLFSTKANGGFEVTTDKEGKWLGTWMASGPWNVDFEKIGYEPKKSQIDIAEQRKNPDMKIYLKKIEGLVLSDDLKELLNKANAFFDQKDYAGAMTGYNEILAKYPDAYFLNRNIGNVYFAQEKYDAAEAAYQKVLEKEPANVAATLGIGNCYANRNQTDKALEWYGKIDFEKIKDAIILYNIGTTYTNLQKYEDALKYYKRSTEVDPKYVDGWYQLGITYISMGKTAEAVTAFEECLKIEPDGPKSAQVKGFLDYLKKK